MIEAGADFIFDDSLYGTYRYLNYVLSYFIMHIFLDRIIVSYWIVLNIIK